MKIAIYNVDNTSDLDKPISIAHQDALDLKANQATTYTKTEVDNAIGVLTDLAPETLDTFNELAAAIGDDADFITTITDSIGVNTTAISNETTRATAAEGVNGIAIGNNANNISDLFGTTYNLTTTTENLGIAIGSNEAGLTVNATAIIDNYAATPHNTDSVIICNQGDNIQDKLDEAALLLGGIGGKTLIVMAGQYGDLSLTDDNLEVNIIGIGNPKIGNVIDEGTFLSNGATYKNFTCGRISMNLPYGTIENITTINQFYVYQNNSTGTIKDIKCGTYFLNSVNYGTIDDITCGTSFTSDFGGNFGTIKNVNASEIYIENNNGTVDNVNATGDLITSNAGVIKNCSAYKFELALNGNNGIIDNCHSNGPDRGFGGYLGSINSGTIKNCTAKGDFSFGQQTALGLTENCTGADQAFIGDTSQVSGNTIEGTYRNCRGGNKSFLGQNTSTSAIKVCTANYINCTAAINSFCFVNTAGAETHFSGTAINCTSGNNGFCKASNGNTKILAGAIIENCTGGLNSFATTILSTNEGTILRCRTSKTGVDAFTVTGTGKVRLCLDGNYNEVNLG